MPNSLRARLKNLVHKGVLTQKDLDRIVIMPVDGTGDMISRQAVLEGLASIAKAKARSDAQKSLMGRSMFFVERLPSVSVKEKVGKWTESRISESVLCECSECGYTCGAVSMNYCPNCGAKMGVEE